MWLIRNQQCKALDDAVLNDFVQRMMYHLVINFGGDLASTNDKLRRLVVDWIRDARGWGLTQEEHVQSYLELCAEFPEMREKPIPERLATILSWPGRLPEVKVEKLQQELLFQDGEQECFPEPEVDGEPVLHSCGRCS
jgi:hypothetical protein